MLAVNPDVGGVLAPLEAPDDDMGAGPRYGSTTMSATESAMCVGR